MNTQEIRNEIDRLFLSRAKNTMSSGYLQAYTTGGFDGFIHAACLMGAITEYEEIFLLRASLIFKIRSYIDEDNLEWNA